MSDFEGECERLLLDVRRQVEQLLREAREQQGEQGDIDGDWRQRLAWHIWAAQVAALEQVELMLDGFDVTKL